MLSRNGTLYIAGILVPGVLLGCGGGGGGETADAGGEMEEEAVAEVAVTTVDPASAATVTGFIAFEGTPPGAEPIDMSEEPTCADAYPEPPMTQEVEVADGRLANVFVYVKEGLSGEFGPPSTPVVLDQRGCRYHPHVFGIQPGQDLTIKNSDGLLHNINTQSQVNRSFNVSQPRSMETTRQFRSPEVMIPVKCDVHGWMHAYIGVVPSPYYSVSSTDGQFTIGNLPPGDYLIEAWHEKYGTQTQQVTVGAQETAEISFAFSADMAGAEVPLGEPLILSHSGGHGH